MTAPVKPFPNEAVSLASAQEFQKTCQQKIPGFDLSKVIITNRGSGNQDGGVYDMLYDDPAGDLFCSARVHWPSHQMKVSFGNHATRKITYQHVIDMKDACTFTSQVIGPEEFGGKTCTDGFLDARLKGAERFESYRFFQNQCQALLGQAYRRSGSLDPMPVIDTSHVNLETREGVPDDEYSLLYSHAGLDFFCRADINSLQGGSLGISHGKLENKDKADIDEKYVIPTMTDGCSMTRALAGEKKMVNPQCKDIDGDQQEKKRILGTAGAFFWTGIAYYSGFRLLNAWIFKPTLTRLAPLGRVAGTWLVDGLIARVSPAAASFLTNTMARSPLLATAGNVAKGGLVSTLLVIGIDQFFEQGVVGDHYKNSVNKRVARMVYEAQGLYDYSGWNAINPVAYLNKSRRLFRWAAPSAMSWAVARDNKEVTVAMLQKDSEDSVKAQSFLGEVLPSLLGESESYQKDSLELMKKPIVLSTQELTQSILLKTEGAEAAKQKLSMNDDQIEALSKKLVLKEAQESIKFLVYVDLPQNRWTREIFNGDGTLKAGQEQSVLQFFPPPPKAVAGK